MRFVLDTNLLVSGVIAAGLPRRLVDGAKAGEFELCTSEVLLAELLDVLSRGKFAARLSQAAQKTSHGPSRSRHGGRTVRDATSGGVGLGSFAMGGCLVSLSSSPVRAAGEGSGPMLNVPEHPRLQGTSQSTPEADSRPRRCPSADSSSQSID